MGYRRILKKTLVTTKLLSTAVTGGPYQISDCRTKSGVWDQLLRLLLLRPCAPPTEQHLRHYHVHPTKTFCQTLKQLLAGMEECRYYGHTSGGKSLCTGLTGGLGQRQRRTDAFEHAEISKDHRWLGWACQSTYFSENLS